MIGNRAVGGIGYRTTQLLSLSILVLSVFGASSGSGASRAVVVGISDYLALGADTAVATGRRLKNLPSARGDAVLFAQILRDVYGFDHIRMLLDAGATRHTILSAIRSELIESASKGDTLVFYFAGHGSQVPASSGKEFDALDETIVPADATLGTPDIRDKELRGLFNKILDVGDVSLTAIFDSCHSGSIARGTLGNLPTYRAVLPGEASGIPIPETAAPSDRGALILSAALENQLARDGLFTRLLRDAIVAGAGRESAAQTFRRTRALMLSMGGIQEPVLEASAVRRDRPLIESHDHEAKSGLSLSVLKIEGEGIVLQGGTALGLANGTRLESISDADPATLEVVEALGFDRSQARLVNGRPEQISVGDLFRVTEWSYPDIGLLSVWLGEEHPLAAQLHATDFARLKNALGAAWVEDPSEESFTHLVYWASGGWQLTDFEQRPLFLGGEVSPTDLLAKLPSSEARVFVNVPPPREMVERIRSAAEESGPLILGESEISSVYGLTGRWTNDQFEFAWINTSLPRGRWASPLPPRSAWQPASDIDAVTTELLASAREVAETKGLLELTPPPGSAPFEYELVLLEKNTQQARNGGVQTIGDVYDLSFKLRDSFAMSTEGFATIRKRFIYLLAIDSRGKRQFLAPKSCMETLQLPTESILAKAPREILLRSDLPVSEPIGIDTIVLLTTASPLDDPCMLAAPSFTRGKSGGDALSQLLSSMGQQGRRGPPVPAGWYVEQIVFETHPRGHGGTPEAN